MVVVFGTYMPNPRATMAAPSWRRPHSGPEIGSGFWPEIGPGHGAMARTPSRVGDTPCASGRAPRPAVARGAGRVPGLRPGFVNAPVDAARPCEDTRTPIPLDVVSHTHPDPTGAIFEAALQDVVRSARRFQAPIAFSRVLRDGCDNTLGSWLEGCRPRITDRLFNHLPGSCFQNREFCWVLERLAPAEVYFAGRLDDSDMCASIADGLEAGHRIRVITPDSLLHFCSAAAQKPDTLTPALNPGCAGVRILISEWYNRLRSVETIDRVSL